MNISDQIMVLDSDGFLIADITTRHDGRAFEATVSVFDPFHTGSPFLTPHGMTRRSAVERTAIRDAIAHALTDAEHGRPVVGRMTASDIAAAHALTLESVFTYNHGTTY